MEVKLPLLLHLLEHIIDIDFSGNISADAKELELQEKVMRHKVRLEQETVKLHQEREKLLDRVDEIDDCITNIKQLITWAQGFAAGN